MRVWPLSFAVFFRFFFYPWIFDPVAVMILYRDWIWTFWFIRWSRFVQPELKLFFTFSTFLLFSPLFLLHAPLLFNCYLLFFFIVFIFTFAFYYSSSSHAYFISLSFIFIVTIFNMYLGLDVILFSAFYFSCHLHFAWDFSMYLGSL